ncbi:MAG: hypothetical protein K8R88_13185 [Armatimonadetes bacterium]|nr:hypothetical protein [Armatimonadota bacterium]
MAKTVSQIEKALKLKAQPKSGAISVKLGAKKFTLPFEVRFLSSKEFIFVHVPPCAGIFSVEGSIAKQVESVDQAEAATKSFRSPSKRAKRAGAKGRGTVEMPDELSAALSKIPAGYKLVSDKKGTRLVKTRTRK